ncbi:flavodoxin I [Saccharicrinis carchari]|uniref:Flavodoxin n=1 Tax=Saccharicrinis carchari TaxID=1168039 RepID=A0A521DDL5_SACCC|nr:flavodoxin [Saccharicrinis carchari]SMO69685.1 flavodoxin I [Saccharicrinis carchari]
MGKTGVFYGPAKGSVAKVAIVIAQQLGEDSTDLTAIKDCDASSLNGYEKLIFGISTLGRSNWDSEHEDDDWDVFFTHLNQVNWKNKRVAIYGLGDQINYPGHFVDAIGWLYQRLKALNVDVYGAVPDEGYQYTDSEAIVDGKFMGLPLDEDNEPEKTHPRIKNWLNDLKQEGF